MTIEEAYIKYLPMIRQLAAKNLNYSCYTYLDYEELVGEGIKTLVESVPKLNDYGNYSYLRLRINGAMIDLIRSVKGTHKNKDGKRIYLGNEIKFDDLNVDCEDTNNIVDNFKDHNALTEEDFLNRQVIRQVWMRLNKNERRILYMYFYKDMLLREIGEAINLTESRVSQIISKILKSIPARLEQKVIIRRVTNPRNKYTRNMYKNNKVMVALPLLRDGKSIREVSRILGMSKVTIAKFADRLLENGVELICKCGRPIKTHKGFCSYRFQQSIKRQEFMRQWHRKVA